MQEKSPEEAKFSLIDVSSPTWKFFEKCMAEAGQLTKHISEHFFSSLAAIHSGLATELNDLKKLCRFHEEEDWQEALLKNISVEHIKKVLFEKSGSDKDLLDRAQEAVQKFASLADTKAVLDAKGITHNEYLNTLQDDLSNGKFFLAVLSAWDLMLGEQPDPKEARAQRLADAKWLKEVVAESCPCTIPASLMT